MERLTPRCRHLLTELCAPYTFMRMQRRHNGYRIAVLVNREQEYPEKKLGYEILMKWIDLGWLQRIKAPTEMYEITPLGRDVVNAFDEPDPEPPRHKLLKYSELARRALGR